MKVKEDKSGMKSVDGEFTATFYDKSGNKSGDFKADRISGVMDGDIFNVNAYDKDNLIKFQIPQDFGIKKHELTDKGEFLFMSDPADAERWYAQSGYVDIENNDVADYRGSFHVKKRSEGDTDKSAMEGRYRLDVSAIKKAAK
ncbi:hypothetical protein [Pseudomonas frederiksbergensis]|jgi:hypothetical protein|uniref:hypothetical protein n=1 Tax=Pseudomonas frederiksbergensis TaxID=104087 RepID=UPI003D1A551F